MKIATFVLSAATAVAGCSAAQPTTSGTNEIAHPRFVPPEEEKAPRGEWWCFRGESKEGEVLDNCLRASGDCDALVAKAQTDDFVKPGTAGCTPQGEAHCFTTPSGRTWCMEDAARCERSFKRSITAAYGWWGAGVACTTLGPEDALPTAEAEPAFAGGECVIAEDGYIWFVARVEKAEYYALGWQGDGWGNEVVFGVGHFETLGYRKTECPERKGPLG